MNIAVIGMGYVGLACVAFARHGHRVVCVDIDEKKIVSLQQGVLPIVESGLPELIAEGQAAGLLSFTTDAAEALQGADVCFICVGTPPKSDGSADLQYVDSAFSSVKALKNPPTVVVIKSTVPVGTCERLGAVSNPEFLREGRAIADFLKPDRIVIGTDDTVAADTLLKLYEPFDCPKLVMSSASSELTKYAANGFLATKISFVNEIANLCDCVGANILDVARAIGLDPRIGESFLQAGLGYGGSCFPKDTSALHKLALSHDHEFELLSVVIEVNKGQRERFAKRVIDALATEPRRVAVWGLTFKAGTDDTRESASLDVIDILLRAGVQVCAYDPMVNETRGAQRWSDRIILAPDPIVAAQDAQALLVLTEWPQFRDVNFEEVRNRMRIPRIFDGRNLLADLDLRGAGFEYVGVGLGKRD